MHRIASLVLLVVVGCAQPGGRGGVDGSPSGGGDGAQHHDAGTDAVGVTADAAPSTPGCPSGMIGWWTGDGNAMDTRGTSPLTWCGYSGNAGDSTCGTTTPTYVTGKVGQAFSFDGTRYVRGLGFAITSGNFTVDLWAKWSNNTQPEWSCALAGSENTSFDSLLRTFQIDSDGSGGVRVQAGNDGIHVPFGAQSTSAFQHLAFVYNGSTVTTYLNGAMAQSMPWTQELHMESIKFGMNRTYDNPYSGAVDEVHIFNRALSATEISGIYATGSTGLCH